MENAPNYDSQVDQAYINGIYQLSDRRSFYLILDRIIEMEKLLQLKQQIVNE